MSSRIALWLLAFLFIFQETTARQFWTAAVFEHARFGSENDTSELIVKTNLNYYKKAAEIAKSKGADVILFPECGIISPSTRDIMRKTVETIPDPKSGPWNPCEEELRSPILYTLSCMAKNNSMVVVANMYDKQECTGHPKCPDDGIFIFNANVVFDRNGTLLVRYHKEHLFFELNNDIALEQQNSTFVTDFGTFATYICFDIDFKRMSEVARWSDIDGIMFSTMWINMAPQMNSIQYWQSWAMGNNVSLLVANIQIPGYFAVGSGVFEGKRGALAYTFNPDGVSKLVVARVPKPGHSIASNASITAITETESFEWNEDGKDVPLVCSRKLLNDSANIYKDYRCFEEAIDNYTFVQLTEPNGHVETCNNGMCCSLEYTTNGLKESFFLGVFNGTYNMFDRYSWCEENCVLARCDPHGNLSCGTFPMKSETVFQNIHLTGNFTTDFVFPSVISSGMRLVPVSDWHEHIDEGNKRTVHFKNVSGVRLLAAGMKGRCYERDPPFKR